MELTMHTPAKAKLKNQLESVYKVLCKYLQDKADDDIEPLIGDIKLRYAIILSAVYDRQYGCKEDRESAIAYFASDLYLQHQAECLLPANTLDYIINNPDKYASSIVYHTDADYIDEGDWL